MAIIPTDLFDQLKASGLPIDEWSTEVSNKRKADPLSEFRPFSVLKPTKRGSIKGLRPGFEEMLKHAHHGAMVPRCQAHSKRTHKQCGAFATKGMNYCRVHGGTKRIGQQTPEGRARINAANTKHGRSTRAALAEQKRINQESRALAAELKAANLTTKDKRAPYAKNKSHDSHKQRQKKPKA